MIPRAILIAIVLLLSCSSGTSPNSDSGSVRFFIQSSNVEFISQSVKVQMPSSANKFNLTATMKSGNTKYSILIVVSEEIESGKIMDINGSNYIILTVTGNTTENFRSDTGYILFGKFKERGVTADFEAELFDIESPLNKTIISAGKIEYESK
jgi:hypothetical protein